MLEVVGGAVGGGGGAGGGAGVGGVEALAVPLGAVLLPALAEECEVGVVAPCKTPPEAAVLLAMVGGRGGGGGVGGVVVAMRLAMGGVELWMNTPAVKSPTAKSARMPIPTIIHWFEVSIEQGSPQV